jgi:hypothetical protein
MGTMKYYKFRSVKSDDLSNDHALYALFNYYAIFSGRKNFNDVFDSKIYFERPTLEQTLFEISYNNIQDIYANEASRWILNGQFTPRFTMFMDKSESALNDMIDTYAIYSLSKHNKCNLLWAHYALKHTGFCIELEFSGIQPSEVRYQNHIGSIPMLDCFVKNNLHLGGKILMDQLLVKLNCWTYEGECRWIASEQLGKIQKGQKFIQIPYDSAHIKVTAVIFGCRMPSCVKNFIRKYLPYKTEFQQAVERKDYIEIVPFDERVHLETQCSHCVEK